MCVRGSAHGSLSYLVIFVKTGLFASKINFNFQSIKRYIYCCGLVLICVSCEMPACHMFSQPFFSWLAFPFTSTIVVLDSLTQTVCFTNRKIYPI